MTLKQEKVKFSPLAPASQLSQRGREAAITTAWWEGPPHISGAASGGCGPLTTAGAGAWAAWSPGSAAASGSPAAWGSAARPGCGAEPPSARAECSFHWRSCQDTKYMGLRETSSGQYHSGSKCYGPRCFDRGLWRGCCIPKGLVILMLLKTSSFPYLPF